ncbi:very short patch repair endonuclease [Rhizobium mongolense]|uniref:very short patch repair endonuclease n=1 Tax=Rhizobium mongolense TaxID=57676 RepID=UPI0034A4D44F
MDHVSPDRRSQIMARIRSRDTKPELAVRRQLHKFGLRFRLHRKDLPGTPDLVFPAKRVALFVHGCFWHGCPHCAVGRRRVKSNETYWNSKLERNRTRDALNAERLAALDWTVLTFWECETKDPDRIGDLARTIKDLPRLG